MTKYHVNDAGEPGRCTAKIGCPFKLPLDQHYSTPEEARAAYEASMDSETFNLSKNSYKPLTAEWVESADENTQRMVMSTFGKLLTHRAYRNTETDVDDVAQEFDGVNWEAVYDSTPAGKLWVERKSKEVRIGDGPNKEYVRRAAAVETFLQTDENEKFAIVVPKDPGDVFDAEFTKDESLEFTDKWHSKKQKVKLAGISASWMTKLSPEETEAVSWMTSNGTMVAHEDLNGVERSVFREDKYSKEHVANQIELFRSAMSKAPELDEPVIIYRGTTTGSIGYLDNETIVIDRPASASVSGSVATSFTNGEGENVMLEIKTKKVASVAGMSAWGVSELEVLAPLGEYRKVGEFTSMRKTRDGERPRDFTKYDEFRVIQLEHIG